MEKDIYAISPSYNSFVFLSPKAGSSTLSWILAYFDFGQYTYNNENSQYEIHRTDIFHFGHRLTIPPTHKNLLYIHSVRHPYDRFVSYFRFSKDLSENPSKKEFEVFIDLFFEREKSSVMYQSFNFFKVKPPDKIVKIESLYEDLNEIQFIKDSKLNKTEILKEMCAKKLHNSLTDGLRDFLFTENTKSKVYEAFREHFEFFKYEK